MQALKSIFLGVFVLVVASLWTDGAEGAGEATTEAPVKGGISVSGEILTIAKLPLKIFKGVIKFIFNTFLKLPFKLVSKVVNAVVKLIQNIQGISADLVSQIIALVKGVIAQLVTVLVDIGVLQGKTTEEVINSVIKIITNVIEFVLHAQVHISTSIVDTVEKIIDGLDIKEIVNKTVNAPFIKVIYHYVIDTKAFIHKNFQTQIDDIKSLIRTQFEEHKEFFDPILEGISSRILILHNALFAFINGDLESCPGGLNPDKSPAGSLKWLLTTGIYKIEVKIFRHLGLAALADKYQAKLDELEKAGTTPAPGSTTLPPIVTTLAASASMSTQPSDTTTSEPTDPRGTTTPSPQEPVSTEAPEGTTETEAVSEPGTTEPIVTTT